MNFTETRGNDGSRDARVGFTDALLSPIASFGGIYAPQTLPRIDSAFLQQHLQSSYKQLAMALLLRLDLDIGADILQQALQLYDRFDDSSNPAPLVKLDHRLFVCELYHGPTRAFKDMALQPFGVLLSSLAQQQQRQYLILTATSGDTGPAALETFRNRDNIRVACLYPFGGTSDVQRLQMVTESANNLSVIGINGNFDDTQAALKSLLASPSFKQRLAALDISLSAANSVNFGRIIFQIIYQFHAYLELLRQQAIKPGDEVVLHIPSGNFGNALGAFYARRLGLPIARIVIASNTNNVLTEWINSGRYDLSKRNLIATTSPAMDILKSSNVERVLFHLYGAERTRDLMRQLDDNGCYQLEPSEHAQIAEIFDADFCSDEEGRQYIKQAYEQGYLMDPHTATCFKNCRSAKYSDRVNIVFATAEWTKFARVVDNAISGNHHGEDLPALQSIARVADIEIPSVIAELFEKPIIHHKVVDRQDIEAEILSFVGQGS